MYTKVRVRPILSIVVLSMLAGMPAVAAVQYSNDFENPSSENVQEAWPDWIIFESGSMQAVNGRIEWDGTGGNNDWIRLDHELPEEYTFEFDFFHQQGSNGRFSVWPFAKEGDSIFERHNYFMRANTHYFDGSDTVPSEGERDLTVPLNANAHRMRVEVTGNHVALLYKDQGEGGWILVDERDFPEAEDPTYVQLGYNHDSGPLGLVWIDNFVLSYREQDVFSYSNNFDGASSENVAESWPELEIFEGGSMAAVNDRIEWDATGGNNDWIRLTQELPQAYTIEFDFLYQEGSNGRFSVWPFAKPGESIFDRHNYFMRKNTHYFNGADTVPSEGERDLTVPQGANPHRIRVEVSGIHVALLYKDQGEGGWILIDERDFPPIDDPRYFQFGYNHDGGPLGLIYVDNLVIQGLSANRAEVSRDVQAEEFVADQPVPVALSIAPTGNIPVLTITEGFPEGWSAQNISNGGVISDGKIIWDLKNVSEEMTITYEALPPRLIRNRVAGFSGSVGSGDEEDRITGDTAIEIDLPYLYREAVDYDFSGSPVDGRNYPNQFELGELYTEGMDGIPSDVAYERPTGDQSIPAEGDVFEFPEDADFHQNNPAGARGDSYAFDDYRDIDEVGMEHGASDTGNGIGAINEGDWWRYTFNFDEDSVILLNMSFNTWGEGDSLVDVYVDNEFLDEVFAPGTPANEFNFFTVGPVPVDAGEHSIVVAFPPHSEFGTPEGFGRMEVVKVTGIGRVARTLTEDGFFNPSQPLEITLTTEALFGDYSAFIIENIPPGAQVTDISNDGEVEGNEIIWDLEATDTSRDITYTIQPPEGTRFLIFDGAADIGLPLADDIKGDTSVVNELWLFGTASSEDTDDFGGSELSDPWFVEYGNDPALNIDYEEDVTIEVANDILTFGADTITMPEKFNEWANGRRAPMILRTDIPDGDWRIETSYALMDTFTWNEYHVGLVVAYNQSDDEDVSGDEYLFGFHSDDLRAELTNEGATGILDYHEYTDEFNWQDAVWAGEVRATIAVTRRGDELIFSAQLPDRPWQLVGPPVRETRDPTRIGLFSKIWGADNFTVAEFEEFSISALDAFTDVSDWALY